MIYYIRDETSNLIGFTYNDNTYYYVKNAQNDIIGILDDTGNKVAEYQYDAYGNHLSITDGNSIDVSINLTHIANINPFRYRSYYFDKESNLYYLNSRYYNPKWGRFINPDRLLGANRDILSYNLYAYVSNNPINMADPTGEIGILLGSLIIGSIGGLFAGGMIGAADSKANTGKVNACAVVKTAAKGAVGGAVVGGIVGGAGYVATALLTPQGQDVAQKGYDTFNQLKTAYGTVQPGNDLHHIVEQSQIIKSGFNPQMVNNFNNVVEIGRSIHYQISGYYSSIPTERFTNGLRFRDWLAGQDFQTQYDWGIKIIEMYK